MDVVVLGCGSQARYVIDNLVSSGVSAPVGLVDIEAGSMVGADVNGVPVRWTLDEARRQLRPDSCELIIAHGENRRKLEAAAQLAGQGFAFRAAVHATASVSPSAEIKAGAIVNAGAVILPNATIEEHAIVHSGCVIEHDCKIGRGANVAPGAILAGRVEVGEAAYLFTGCRVAPGIKIGAHAVIGAGAVVLSAVADGVTAFGVPARQRPSPDIGG
jgi:sugar O-acyltransferase (sialic acid O-acetyltransferase NeuD family)